MNYRWEIQIRYTGRWGELDWAINEVKSDVSESYICIKEYDTLQVQRLLMCKDSTEQHHL